MQPLLHDFTGERILVVGGGSVGARKARHFAGDASVLVVSPCFADADFGGAERVLLSMRPEGIPVWLDRIDPALVVAATDDPGLNADVETAALEANILVNRADRAGAREPGSVVLPATVEADPVVLAIGTGGTSPALSRFLRERIESELPELEHAGEMATLLGELRADLAAGTLPVEATTESERGAALRAVLRSREVWKAFHTTGVNPREIAVDVMDETSTADRGEAR